ncbi:enolase [Candidatus Woesearchaeota archaeon]|nr:enolase [Candidatus Woesearchaeota archaeon]
MLIKELKARIIKNSRNENAIEVIVNKKYVASAPSGASTGMYEAKAFTKDVKFAVNYLNNFSVHYDFEEFKDLEVLDHLKLIIGGNPTIALQYAVLKAMSKNKVYNFLNPRAKRLPIPLGNCVGGGAHTKIKASDIQEFLLIPEAKTFSQMANINRNVYDMIGKLSKAKHKTDEGAFILNERNEDIFEFLTDLVYEFREHTGYKVNFGVDVAASQFFKKGKYHYNNSKQKVLTREKQIYQINDWIKEYNLGYVEDGLEENDFSGFAKLNKKTLICGDDLITTNLERLKKAVKAKSVNCMIVKPNQIGSLIETKKVVDFAHKHGIKTVISHRSGETMDPMIAHLAVGWNMNYIKTGIFGKEREVKLKELARIEREII